MCVASALTATVRDYQGRTGEESLLILLHLHDEDERLTSSPP